MDKIARVLLSLLVVTALLFTVLPAKPVRATASAQPMIGGGGGGVWTTGSAHSYYLPGINSGGTDEANATVYWPTAGTFSDLHVDIVTAAGVGNSWTLALRKNASDTSLTVTLSGAETSDSNTAASVSVAQGDAVNFHLTYSGSPGATYRQWYVLFTPTTADETVLVGCNGDALNSGATEYAALHSGGLSNCTWTSTETQRNQPVPTDGTFKKLSVNLSIDPGTAPDAYRFTMRKNAASQSVTTTVTADATTGIDAVNSFSVVQGDLVDIMCEPLDTPSATPIVTWAAVFISTTSGESIVLGCSQDIPSDEYFMNFSSISVNTGPTESYLQQRGPAVDVKKLTVWLSTSPGASNTSEVYFRLNGANTSLVVAISGASITGSDNAHVVTLAAGDLINYRYNKIVGGAAKFPYVMAGAVVTLAEATTGPAVTTNAATDVSSTTATLNGEVTALNDTLIDNRGFVYDTSTHGDPGNVVPGSSGYAHYWLEAGTYGVEAFDAAISSLPCNDTIYFRAFAQNDTGIWTYGSELNFNTLTGLPTMDTLAATDVLPTTATLNGEITAIDGTSISVRGFVWDDSTHGDPGNVAPAASSYPDYWTQSGTYGTGTYDHGIGSLTGGLTYYFRSVGQGDCGEWVYGPELNFTTSSGIPTVVTDAASSIEETTAILNGQITNLNGGGNAVERGFVWGTTTQANPGNTQPSLTAYDSYWTEVGSFGIAAFLVGASSLDEGELYYFRACAASVSGWAYGAEEKFLTKPIEPAGATAVNISAGTIRLTWVKGTGALNTYIRGKVGGYPANIADGVLVYNNVGVTYDHSGLTGGDVWYYKLWSYATEGGLSQYSDSYDATFAGVVALPTVITAATDARDIALTSAVFNGSITADGGATINYRGFVWDTLTHGDPGDVAPAASGYSNNYAPVSVYPIGDFDYSGATLVASTTYYIRALAHNTMGWAYGNEEIVITWADALWYQPDTIISGTTLPDRAGVAQDGVISWGANPADIDVNEPTILSPSGSSASVPDAPTPDAVGNTPGESVTTTPSTVPTDWPLYGLFESWAADLEIDIAAWYVLMGTLLALILGTLAFAMFKGSFGAAYIVAISMEGLVVYAMSDAGVLAWWYLILYLVIVIPLSILLLHRGDMFG